MKRTIVVIWVSSHVTVRLSQLVVFHLHLLETHHSNKRLISSALTHFLHLTQPTKNQDHPAMSNTFRYCRSACRRRRWVISCRLRFGPPPPGCEDEDSSFLISIPRSHPTPPSSSALLSSEPSRTMKPPGRDAETLTQTGSLFSIAGQDSPHHCVHLCQTRGCLLRAAKHLFANLQMLGSLQ